MARVYFRGWSRKSRRTSTRVAVARSRKQNVIRAVRLWRYRGASTPVAAPKRHTMEAVLASDDRRVLRCVLP